MRRHVVSCLTIIFLGATSGAAQSMKKRPKSTPSPAPITDIRKVDFLNFPYRSSLCSQEYGKQGIGKTVLVRDGEYKKKGVYFSTEGEKTVYGDLTGDGNDDAIVPVTCGAEMANFSRSEIYVYTIKDGRAALLAGITDKDLERDYRHAYPDAETYWGVTGDDLQIKDGNLEIRVLADGPHAAPKYVSTLEYHWSGGKFQLAGKPERKDAPQ